ncbi:MAG: cation diffusion facilitator family transporter [Chloroflexota bacterium]
MPVHSHQHPFPATSKLKFGILLSSLILVAEVAGGLLSNSLALLADAGHVLADVIALSLSWYGIKQAERPASNSMTFGYHRVGVLVAIINALSIFAIVLVIFYEAFRRLQQPPEVNGPLMLAVATVGLSANLFIAFWLRKEQKTNLNIRSAFWHSIGDALASIGVIVGGVIILITGISLADPIISIFIGFVIILAAWNIFRDGLRVILEATPRGLDIKKMVESLNQIIGVRDVHDVHVWSITPEMHTMSCHVLIDDLATSEAAKIREKIREVLSQQFNIEHATLQMECEQCSTNDILCQLTIDRKKGKSEKPPT